METELFGFFIGVPNERIYQKVKYSRRYEQGTLLYVDVDEVFGSNVDYTNLPAFTPSDADYETGTPKYVGCVAPQDGLTATANSKITICANAEIDIDKYNMVQDKLVTKNGSTTMGLPPEAAPNSLIVGFGKMKVTQVLGGHRD